MDFKVIFNDSFLEDLHRIVRWIAVDNPQAARKLGETIVQTAEGLTFFPERYPRVRRRPEIRRFIVHRNFKVFYRVHAQSRTVEILRCWDGRQESQAPILE